MLTNFLLLFFFFLFSSTTTTSFNSFLSLLLQAPLSLALLIVGFDTEGLWTKEIILLYVASFCLDSLTIPNWRWSCQELSLYST